MNYMMKYSNQRKNKSGFTLIELVIVMLVASIIAVFVFPRLDISGFRSTGFFQQAITTIRFAQKQAIASGCTVQVDISGSDCNLNWVSCGAAGNDPILNPANNDSNFCSDSTPSGGISNGSFRFDNIGRPMDNSGNILTAAQDVTIGNRTIRVEAETGYTHEN